MRILLQRVSRASVTVDGKEIGSIGSGLLLFVGVKSDDTEAGAKALAEKVVNLRIFSDQEGKMNLSLLDVKGETLIVSQFTLYGDCRKGRRPSFVEAAPPEEANRLYLYFVEQVRGLGVKVATGLFQAHMAVKLVNDGPVTLML